MKLARIVLQQALANDHQIRAELSDEITTKRDQLGARLQELADVDTEIAEIEAALALLPNPDSTTEGATNG